MRNGWKDVGFENVGSVGYKSPAKCRFGCIKRGWKKRVRTTCIEGIQREG